MNKVYSYKLNYVLWDMDTNRSQLIKDDVVSYPEPKDHNQILVELWRKWQLLKGDNIQIGNMDIIILGV